MSQFSNARPLWVKLTCWALGLTLGLPVLLSLISSAHRNTWQLVALLIAGLWLAVCGFFTLYSPLPMARYFGRPGTYDLMLTSPPSTLAMWFLGVASVFMLLLGLLIAGGCSLLLLPSGVAHR